MSEYGAGGQTLAAGVTVLILKSTFGGFSHRFAYAALISALVWIFTAEPFPAQLYPLGAGQQLLRWFDFPIALATQVLPCDDFAIDLWFTGQGGEGCPF